MNVPFRHQADDIYAPMTGPSVPTAQRYFRTDGNKRRPAQTVTLETGLEEAPHIDVTLGPKTEPAILEPVERAISKLKALRDLAPHWDSYSAKIVDRRTIRPALDLVLRSIQKCLDPRIEATPSGHIELLWEAPEKVLEAEVSPAGRYTCLLILDGEETEADDLSLEGAARLLEQYRRH